MKKLFNGLIAICLMLVMCSCATKVDDVDAVVEDGDIVNIDFEGYFNGVQFAGGSAEGYSLTIGSHSFVDDFEEQLIGMKVNEKKTITVTFPSPYLSMPSLAGQDVQFDVTINEIKR